MSHALSTGPVRECKQAWRSFPKRYFSFGSPCCVRAVAPVDGHSGARPPSRKGGGVAARIARIDWSRVISSASQSDV